MCNWATRSFFKDTPFQSWWMNTVIVSTHLFACLLACHFLLGFRITTAELPSNQPLLPSNRMATSHHLTFTHDLPFWQKRSRYVTSTHRRHLEPISARNRDSYTTHTGKIFATLISFTCDICVLYTPTYTTRGTTIERNGVLYLCRTSFLLITLERVCLSVCRHWDFGFAVKPQRRRRWRRN